MLMIMDINISFQNHDTFNNLKAFVDVLAEKCDFQSYLVYLAFMIFMKADETHLTEQ